MQCVQAQVCYRVPLVGGFTDFPEFYKNYGGESITLTIRKFLTVSIAENAFGGLDVQSRSDLPWGIGLGSSGAYHSALILAFLKLKGRRLSKVAIANLAYQLETGVERHSTGRQDSLACLLRGISRIHYCRDGSIKSESISVPREWRKKLNERLLLFDIGGRRRARDSIKDIISRNNTSALKRIAKLPTMLLQAWKEGDVDFLGTAIDLQERYRRQVSPTCENPQAESLLQAARKCGAGARLTGAGIGTLLCYCRQERQQHLRDTLRMPEIPFSIFW